MAAFMLTLTGLIGLDVSPASAANGTLPCLSTCDGKDPATYKRVPYPHDPSVYYYCADDAVTVKQATADNWKIQLRYSAACETTWLRIVDTTTGCICPFQIKHVSTYTTGSVRKTIWGYDPSNNGSDWTSMLDDHGLLNYGCIYVYDGETATSPYASACTGKY
jgi:hypothetical protein